jgi:hypothetical protein
MERHHLVERAAPPDLVRVVGEICGLHAQLMSSAELSLWARIDGLEPDAVHEALWKQRSLVKLWKHVRKGRRLMVEIEPFGRLPAWARVQVEAEAERLAEYLDGELDLTLVRRRNQAKARG